MSLIGGEDGKVILAGLGKSSDVSVHDFRKFGAVVFASIKKVHGNDFTVRFTESGVAHMAAFAEGMMLRNYSYD
jgi:alanine dehydrogenase